MATGCGGPGPRDQIGRVALRSGPRATFTGCLPHVVRREPDRSTRARNTRTH